MTHAQQQTWWVLRWLRRLALGLALGLAGSWAIGPAVSPASADTVQGTGTNGQCVTEWTLWAGAVAGWDSFQISYHAVTQGVGGGVTVMHGAWYDSQGTTDGGYWWSSGPGGVAEWWLPPASDRQGTFVRFVGGSAGTATYHVSVPGYALGSCVVIDSVRVIRTLASQGGTVTPPPGGGGIATPTATTTPTPPAGTPTPLPTSTAGEVCFVNVNGTNVCLPPPPTGWCYAPEYLAKFNFTTPIGTQGAYIPCATPGPAATPPPDYVSCTVTAAVQHNCYLPIPPNDTGGWLTGVTPSQTVFWRFRTAGNAHNNDHNGTGYFWANVFQQWDDDGAPAYNLLQFPGADGSGYAVPCDGTNCGDNVLSAWSSWYSGMGGSACGASAGNPYDQGNSKTRIRLGVDFAVGGAGWQAASGSSVTMQVQYHLGTCAGVTATPGPTWTPPAVTQPPNYWGGGTPPPVSVTFGPIDICPNPRPTPEIQACVKVTPAPSGATIPTFVPTGPASTWFQDRVGALASGMGEKVPFGYVAQVGDALTEATDPDYIGEGAGGCADWSFTLPVWQPDAAGGSTDVDGAIGCESFDALAVIRPVALAFLVLAWGFVMIKSIVGALGGGKSAD